MRSRRPPQRGPKRLKPSRHRSRSPRSRSPPEPVAEAELTEKPEPITPEPVISAEPAETPEPSTRRSRSQRPRCWTCLSRSNRKNQSNCRHRRRPLSRRPRLSRRYRRSESTLSRGRRLPGPRGSSQRTCRNRSSRTNRSSRIEPTDGEPIASAEQTEAREPVAMASAKEAAPQDPGRDVDEPKPVTKGVTLAAVEIAAEPPAPDDVALLVGPPEPAFSEPPIVPPEPAFWEPEAWSRAPFAIDAWDTHPAESRQEQRTTAVAEEPVTPDAAAPPTKTTALPVGPDPAPDWPETPRSSASPAAPPQSEPTGAASHPGRRDPRPRPPPGAVGARLPAPSAASGCSSTEP